MQDVLNYHLYKRASLSPSPQEVQKSHDESGRLFTDEEQEIMWDILYAALVNTGVCDKFNLVLRLAPPVSFTNGTIVFNVPAYFTDEHTRLNIVHWFFGLPPTERYNVLVGVLLQGSLKIVNA